MKRAVAAQLSAVVAEHCADRGYVVAGPVTARDGCLEFEVWVAGRDTVHGAAVRLALNGELFRLSFPEGYVWADFAMHSDEVGEVLRDVLAFLDAYADPATREVEVRRRLRGPRRELHVSNGTVLRRPIFRTRATR